MTEKARWARQPVKQTRYNLCPSSNNFNLQSINFHNYAAKTLLAQHLAQPFYHQPSISHIYDSAGKKQKISQLLNGHTKLIWTSP